MSSRHRFGRQLKEEEQRSERHWFGNLTVMAYKDGISTISTTLVGKMHHFTVAIWITHDR